MCAVEMLYRVAGNSRYDPNCAGGMGQASSILAFAKEYGHLMET